ncbi:hypothetical protein CHARACLAT_033313 [Characodon lateralis]|uniref:Uncharacterized protein n=1 Tax=Characodon lateralis TaxID=208331 RepID=A0ABU7EGR7_9TELE|nr:hypothetical protein [Characodon lateralis]
MLQIFNKSVVESLISSAIIKLIKKAGSVLGTPLEVMVQRRILHKMKNIMENPDHPLHQTVLQQQSVFSQRLLQICCKTDTTGDPSCPQHQHLQRLFEETLDNMSYNI